ncbi:MAG: hemolysin family protein [Planctomycetes bacterium]|nr:hemolysin family protein [Planctomycetota bacterium]
MVVFIASLAVALGVSFLCSLMEATLLSLTPSQVAVLCQKHPKAGAAWRKFKQQIDRPIAVILLLNTSAHTIGASVAGSRFDQIFGDEWIWLFSLLFTFAMLQYTEILPKTLGVRLNQKLAVWIATPLAVSMRVLTPLTRAIHFLNRPFEFGIHRAGPSTLDEIRALASMARVSEQIGSHQERIIVGASRLSHLEARQVMIPADQASFLSGALTVSEALKAALNDLHTRYPVCEGGDRDRVAGYVNFKELALHAQGASGADLLRNYMRPVHFAAPESRASDLLRVFVEQYVHLAIVHDAQGKVLGLVTLEDLVEELVGELEDEFDRLPRHLHALACGQWMAGGGAALPELEGTLSARFPGASGNLGAWLEARLGRAVKVGDVVRESGLDFAVRRTRRGRPFEIAISKAAAECPPTSG